MPLRNVLALLVIPFATPAPAQSVLSAQSGLIHLFEGSISIDGKPIAQEHGRFPQLAKGSVLSVDEGKVEVLLGPGTFLWLGPNSALRMEETNLPDARIQILRGSAVMQRETAVTDAAVTVIYENLHVSLPAHGLFRLDATPPAQFTALMGEADVAINGRVNLVVKEKSRLAMVSGETTPLNGDQRDELGEWARKRSDLIAADKLEREEREARASRAKNRTRRTSRKYPSAMIPFPGRTR